MNGPKVMVIVGFGPGISTAVAEKFGAEGFSVALMARNKDRLAAGVSALAERGITAAGFPVDAGDPAAVREAIGRVQGQLGPVTALHWNAFLTGEARDLLTTDPAAVPHLFDVAVGGLLAAVQAALPDLRASGQGAVLVTNGAAGEPTAQMDELSVRIGSMGVALANAAKYKLVGLLAARLKGEGVYVGEVMIAGTIKGTAWETADSIDPVAVADRFWDLYSARDEVRARIA